MKYLVSMAGLVALSMALAISSCAVPRQETAVSLRPGGGDGRSSVQARKEEAKAKPVRASGNVGLIDAEKNYLILVTREGKLIAGDFSGDTKVTRLVPENARVEKHDSGAEGCRRELRAQGR
jgi:hypothetical protein